MNTNERSKIQQAKLEAFENELLTNLKKNRCTMPIWSELRNNFYDEEEGFIHIDGWLTGDDDEGGLTIAKIDVLTKEVIYIDERAKTDSNVIEIINETILELTDDHKNVPQDNPINYWEMTPEQKNDALIKVGIITAIGLVIILVVTLMFLFSVTLN